MKKYKLLITLSGLLVSIGVLGDIVNDAFGQWKDVNTSNPAGRQVEQQTQPASIIEWPGRRGEQPQQAEDRGEAVVRATLEKARQDHKDLQFSGYRIDENGTIILEATSK